MARVSKAAAFEHYLAAEAAADADVIQSLFGRLLEDVPAPVRERVHQKLAMLRNVFPSSAAGLRFLLECGCILTPVQQTTTIAFLLLTTGSVPIVEAVTKARRGEYPIPGSAIDSVSFIESVNYLAHVQWTLEQGRVRALEELAGSQAAKDFKRSKAGNEAQAVARAETLPDGHPLKNATGVDQRRQIIQNRAVELRAAHPNLNESDIKRRLAQWADLSTRQIDRILDNK